MSKNISKKEEKNKIPELIRDEFFENTNRDILRTNIISGNVSSRKDILLKAIDAYIEKINLDDVYSGKRFRTALLYLDKKNSNRPTDLGERCFSEHQKQQYREAKEFVKCSKIKYEIDKFSLSYFNNKQDFLTKLKELFHNWVENGEFTDYILEGLAIGMDALDQGGVI